MKVSVKLADAAKHGTSRRRTGILRPGAYLLAAVTVFTALGGGSQWIRPAAPGDLPVWGRCAVVFKLKSPQGGLNGPDKVTAAEAQI